MKAVRMLLLAVIPLTALGACTTLSDQDRALISSANQNAQQAKDLAQQALDTARAAQANANDATQNANAAAQSATQAASDAKAANEKADRMFQRSLRKTTP